MVANSCELSVELDADDSTVQPGDDITGTVAADVSDECPCDELEVQLQWNTHGRGDPDQSTVLTEYLFEGTWEPGGPSEYQFSFEAPDGPFTYRGEYLNLDWRVRATADIPWAFDPEADGEFVLERGPIEEYAQGSSQSAKALEKYGDAIHTARNFMIGGVLFFVAAVMAWNVAPGIAEALGHGAVVAPAFLTLLPGIPFGISVYFLYQGFRDKFAEMKLGDVEVSVEPEVVSPGGEVRAEMQFTPEKDVDLNRADFAFRCIERAIDDQGSQTHTYEHTVHDTEHHVDQAKDTSVSAGTATSYEASFPVPDDAPCTFYTRGGHLLWKVRCNIDIDSWPDWTQDEYIQVRPSERASTGRDSEQVKGSGQGEFSREW